MNKYPKYKISKFDWLGEVPDHWVITKNRYGFIKSNNGSNQTESTPVLSLTTKGVKVKENLNFGKSSESYIGHQLVEVGDIVFTPRDFDQTPILSDVSKYSGCISNLYIVDKTKNNVLNYFVNYYWYGLKYSVNYFKNFSHGMRYSFNRFQFDEIPLLVPSLSEQHKIVQFLDEKTELIDKLISTKERKIILLKEQRISLINQVVTKGLNPKVEMKNSGVEWIGEISQSWNFIPMKYFTIRKNGIQTGPFGTQLNTKDYTESGVKVLNQKTLINDEYILGEEFISYEKFQELKGFNVMEGDLIMGTRGSFGTSNRTTFGKVSEVPSGLGDCVLHPCLIRIRLNDNLVNKTYFKYYINDSTLFLDQIRNTSNSTTIEVIYGVTLKDIKIPIPSKNEQLQIVDYLNLKTKEIDDLIQLVQNKIDLLKEYRQSLISEVVTGKIKVTTDE